MHVFMMGIQEMISFHFNNNNVNHNNNDTNDTVSTIIMRQQVLLFITFLFFLGCCSSFWFLISGYIVHSQQNHNSTYLYIQYPRQSNACHK